MAEKKGDLTADKKVAQMARSLVEPWAGVLVLRWVADWGNQWAEQTAGSLVFAWVVYWVERLVWTAAMTVGSRVARRAVMREPSSADLRDHQWVAMLVVLKVRLLVESRVVHSVW